MKVTELFEAVKNVKIYLTIPSTAAKLLALSKKDQLDAIWGGEDEDDEASKKSFIWNQHIVTVETIDKLKDGRIVVQPMLETFEGEDVSDVTARLQKAFTAWCKKFESLKEAYEPPARNPKLGYSKDKSFPTGATKEWLKSMGATPTDIHHAMRKIKQTQEYRDMFDVGMSDRTSERERENGTLNWEGTITEPKEYYTSGTKIINRRIRYKVLASGKIDAVMADDYHRYPVGSPKPSIIPGDPVGSIVKSMSRSLASLKDTIQKRRKSAEKAVTKLKAEPKGGLKEEKRLSFPEFQKAGKSGKAKDFPAIMNGNDLDPSLKIIVYPGASYIEQQDSGKYSLIIGNEEWTDTDLAKLEHVLYSEWYAG